MKKKILANVNEESKLDRSYDKLVEKCDGFDEGGLIFQPTPPEANVRTPYPINNNSTEKKVIINNEEGGIINIYP